MSDVVVSDNPEEQRYEARLDGELAGFSQYHLTRSAIVFTHTEVDPAYKGRGVASAIARFALDDVRAKGERDVVPVCPFIHGFIDDHPEYADLVRRHGETEGVS